MESFLDLQSTLLCLVTIFSVMASAFIVYFSAAIIKSFGFDSKEAALLNIPSGVFAIASILGFTLMVQRGYGRWLGMSLGSAFSTLGACLVAFLPAERKVGLLIGVYMLNTVS